MQDELQDDEYDLPDTLQPAPEAITSYPAALDAGDEHQVVDELGEADDLLDARGADGHRDELAGELDHELAEASGQAQVHDAVDELAGEPGPSHEGEPVDELADELADGARPSGQAPVDELEQPADELAYGLDAPRAAVDEPDDLFDEAPAAAAAAAVPPPPDAGAHDELFDADDDELAFGAPGVHSCPPQRPFAGEC